MKYSEFLKLSLCRLRSKEDYLRFQQFQAKWVISDSLRKIDLNGKNILDLGSGFGGYSQELANYQARIYSIDLNITQHPQKKQINIFQINADCRHLPIRSGSIDLVFCSSLIEHVADQEQLMSEVKRVLKTQGICYLSFPPFFSPVGGHQFKPFHLLGERFAVILSKIFYGLKTENYQTSYGNWGLFPTTIQKVLKLVKRYNFEIINITTRFSPLNFAKVPIFNEILTWHVEFILQKNE